MLAFHAGVHGELHGDGGGFAGFERHRTDGRDRRSTPLHDFDIRGFGKLKRSIANIGQGKAGFDWLANFDCAQIDPLQVGSQRRRAVYLYD